LVAYLRHYRIRERMTFAIIQALRADLMQRCRVFLFAENRTRYHEVVRY